MKSIPKAAQLQPKQLRLIRSFLPAVEPEISGDRRIAVCATDISDKEKSYVADAVASTWLSSDGAYVKKFEQAFAKSVTHTKEAIAVNSGTSGLHLSLLACGIGEGDEVIVPTFTMIASINAIIFCGATPVLVDADSVTWNMDVEQVARKIGPKTRAIMVVHIYGLMVDMDPLRKLARKHSLWIIEDASEAHGSEYKGKRAGQVGDIAAFSMYANKIITTGEGGIVTTNNKKLAQRVRSLRDQAFSVDRHFWHSLIGYNYRMPNLSAAVGYAQVQRIDELVAKRRMHAALYSKLLRDIPGVTLPVEPKGYKNTYWMYGIVINSATFGMNKNVLRAALARRGIETR